MSKKQQPIIVTDFNNKSRDLLFNLVTIFFDLILLFGWAYAQYVYQLLKPSIFSNFDSFTTNAFQIVFFVSTLCPVLISIYKHVRIMINRANKEIEETV
jgi:hypothetical protein